ncbi:colicin immunity domain-containing protein [Ewingella americana]|jgi:hypothetical protein|uniref:colicin immunity domain-containing protein n=1 Tax=Ewingella americana TaxID=41202 RepID=UPI00163ABA4C|nr:colicin immunity domain-containing protein [Ewingella americana]QMV53026.1 colicin immunity protein [Ewingella americana]
MSFVVLEFAKSFVRGRLNGTVFTEAYSELWRIERDSGLTLKDEDKLSECLSSIFCLADLYNPEPDREDYELDEEQLRDQISKLVDELTI